MLARWIRTWDSKILRPLLLLIHKGGLTPNMLTVSGLIVMVISGVQLARGDWLVGGLILLIGALLDGIDGELARLTRSETGMGALLDSLSDHCGDFALYLGLLWFSLARQLEGNIIFILVALFGSTFGSLVRSRAGMLGIDTKDIGLFTRFERILILLLGLFLDKLTPALCVLAVFNNFSAFQRVHHVFRLLFSLQKSHKRDDPRYALGNKD